RVRSRSPSDQTSAPSISTRPDVGRSSAAMQCNRVDFPEPDGPMMTVNRPAGIVTDTRSSATTRVAASPYTLVSSHAAAATPPGAGRPVIVPPHGRVAGHYDGSAERGRRDRPIVYDRPPTKVGCPGRRFPVIRVLLVDDEQLVRQGLRMILESAGDSAVVAEAADGGEAVEQAIRHRPDAVLMDIRMPGVDGLTATERIAGLPDPPKIVMLTTFELDEYVHTALRHGAVGFLL